MSTKQKSKVPSPCISVCTMDEDTGYCRGCLRTLSEIAEWDRYNDIQKLSVLEKLDQRQKLSGNESSHC